MFYKNHYKRLALFILSGSVILLLIGAQKQSAAIPVKQTHTVISYEQGASEVPLDATMAQKEWDRQRLETQKKRVARVARKEKEEQEAKEAAIQAEQDRIAVETAQWEAEQGAVEEAEPVALAEVASQPVAPTEVVSEPVVEPVVQSVLEPDPPAMAQNLFGIAGIYKPFQNLGYADTEAIQGVIDTGVIATRLEYFSGTDGQTTYFVGHNPGVMAFMEENLFIGAIVTATDSQGHPFSYRMIDKVDVDIHGKGILKSIGIPAYDAYYSGTGEESILIQFCNSYDGLMSFWYGIPA